MPRRIDPDAGRAAVRAWADGARARDLHEPTAATAPDFSPAPDRTTVATAVRFTLQLLADGAPGQALEVRVPPFGAVQCLEGPSHRRGTPPGVVEMTAAVWLALATGARSWTDARDAGAVSASGERADLDAHLPLDWEQHS
jgi:hypothetical protein